MFKRVKLIAFSKTSSWTWDWGFDTFMGNETIYVLLSTCHTVFMIPGAIKKKVLNGFFGTDISIVSRRNYDS